MKTISRGLLTVAAACLAVSAFAETAAREYSLEIERLPLAAALTEFSKQTGLQVGYFPETLTENIFVGPLSGRYTADDAMAQLLSPKGLSFERLNERTIAVTGPVSKRLVTPISTVERITHEPTKFSFVRLANMRLAEGPAGEEDVQQIRTAENARESSDNKRRSSRSIEEVIVTAQKREERAFDVPISIVAMGADELQERKITSLDDLELAVPGLSIQSSGSFQRRIMLRGISNTFGSSSLIGLYLDEASVTSSPAQQLDLRTYDLERIEVLRGPQGTLYGEGSVGGTIRFITKNPQLDQFAMNADVTGLFTHDGEPSGRIDGMLNVPLIENELGLRIAGTIDRQGGWMDQPAADRKDFNDQNLKDVRIKGLWQPAQHFRLNAMAVIHRNDIPPNTGEDASGNYTQVFNLTTTPSGEIDYDLYNLTLTYDFAAARILSTTGYIKQDEEIRDHGARFQLTPPGTPRFDFLAPLRAFENEILTEELRLTSIGSEPLQWTVGGFYRRAESESLLSGHFGLPGAPGTPLPAPFLVPGRGLSESGAVFGDASYKLADHLTVGAGLRYFEEDQQDKISGQTETFKSTNPRVYLQYNFTDHINAYTSAAKGFRSGGANGFNLPNFDPETVWTYELGTKMSLLAGRLSADAAIFSSDYTDYQVLGIVLVGAPAQLLQIMSNAGDASIKGIEWALTWRPTDLWSLSFNGNYVDSEFKKMNAISSTHAVGDGLDLFPEYGYTVSAQRDLEWNGKPGFVRLDYNEQGRATFRNRTIGPWYFNETDVLNMLHFHMGIQWSDNLSLGLFAQNLLNDRDFTDALSIEEFAGRSRPRTVGLEFGVTFD